MREGFGECKNCGAKYYVSKIQFPFKDIAHDVCCPACHVTVGRVPKGTVDYNITLRK